MRILAVDPGERVGWCIATVTDGVALDEQHRLSVQKMVDENREIDPLEPVKTHPIKLLRVDAHGISFLKDAALAIHKAVVLEDRIDVIVYETWILTARGARVSVGSDMQSSQFVGMVRMAAWLNHRVQLVPQSPGAMRSADKSMRAHPSGAAMQEIIDKLPKAHDESHDGSALRHAWTYFFERYV